MSTRAMYTFKDEFDEFHVYKHFDGYPEGAVQWIENALKYAWPLPRFEAGDFGAAFIAAARVNNWTGGDTRLMPSGNWQNVCPGDVEYHYEISIGPDSELRVVARSLSDGKKIFDGTLNQMKEKFNQGD